MKITKIKGINLKGRTFEHDITKPITIFTGNNQSGKTSRLLAIDIALRGYHPSVAKSAAANNNKAVFQFASGRSMAAGVEFEDGSSAYYSARIEKNKIIVDRIEPGDQCYSEIRDSAVLDSEHFFKLGPTDRQRYVFEVADLGDAYSIESVKKRLTYLIKAEHFADARDAMTSIVSQIDSDEFETTQEKVESDIKEIQEILRDANAEKTQSVNSLRQLAEMEADTIVSTGSESRLSTDYSSLDARRKTAVDRGSTAFAALTTIRQQADNIAAQDLFLSRNGWEKSEKCKKEISSELDEINMVRTRPEIPIESECNLLKSDVDDAESASQSAFAASQVAISRKDSMRSLAAEVKSVLDDMEKVTECPHCGSQHEGWQSKLKSTQQDLLSERKNSFKELSKESASLLEAATEAQNEAKSFRKMFESLREKQLRSVVLDEALRILNSTEANLGDPESLKVTFEDCKEVVSKIDAELLKLREADRLQAKAQEREKQKGEAQLNLEKVEFKTNAAKSLIEELKLIRFEMVEVAFKSILKVGNKIFGSVLGWKFVYESGTLGYYNEKGRFIPNETWSGSEIALGYAAVGLGLSSRSPMKLLRMDELARLSPNLFEKLMECISKAVDDGIIDQFIGASPVEISSCSEIEIIPIS